MRRLGPRDRATLVLLGFYLLVAFTFEVYWLVNARALPERAPTDLWARLFSIYGDCDRAYYDRVTPLALCLEGINVLFTQALNALLIFGIVKARPWRHPLQLAVSAYLSYSVVLYFLEAHVSGYANMRYRSAYTYALFYGVNAPWLLGHLWMAWDSFVTLTGQARARASSTAGSG